MKEVVLARLLQYQRRTFLGLCNSKTASQGFTNATMVGQN